MHFFHLTTLHDVFVAILNDHLDFLERCGTEEGKGFFRVGVVREVSNNVTDNFRRLYSEPSEHSHFFSTLGKYKSGISSGAIVYVVYFSSHKSAIEAPRAGKLTLSSRPGPAR